MNKHLPADGIVIRPASVLDIEVIREVAAKTWPSSYTALLGQDQVNYMLDQFYSHSSLEDQMKKGHYFYLALKAFHPVGFTSFSRFEEDIYKLQKLYVLPGEQKNGIGIKLLETVETVAKSMGARILQLNVNRQNKARQFYERNGFSVIEEEDIAIGQGYFMNDYLMQKDLLY